MVYFNWRMAIIYFAALVLAMSFQNCAGDFEAKIPAIEKSSSGTVEFDASSGDPDKRNSITFPPSSGSDSDDDSGSQTSSGGGQDASGSADGSGSGDSDVNAPAGCGVLEHGESNVVTRFQAPSVPAGSVCVSQQQTQTCSDGVLSALAPNEYKHVDCFVEEAPAPCGSLQSGQVQTRVRYEASTVPFGQSCKLETQTRTCNNGAVSSFKPNNFNAVECNPSPPENCAGASHGGTRTRERFMAPTVPAGETCQVEVQVQTCLNGEFTAYAPNLAQHTDCAAETPPAPPADCGAVAHGASQTRTRYLSATVPYGSTCQSEVQARVCTDGAFGPWSSSAYTEVNCQPEEPADCDSLGMTHAQTQTRTRFLVSEVADVSQCESQVQARTCSNGAVGSWSPNTYSELECNSVQARPVSIPAVVTQPLVLTGNPTFTLNNGSPALGIERGLYATGGSNITFFQCGHFSHSGQVTVNMHLNSCAVLDPAALNQAINSPPYWVIESVVHVKGNFKFNGVIFVKSGGKLVIDGDLYIGTGVDKPGLLLIDGGPNPGHVLLTERASNQFFIGPDPMESESGAGGAIVGLGVLQTNATAVNPSGTCQLGEKIIPNGGSTPAYLKSTSQDCEGPDNMQIRTCDHGVFTGFFKQESCTPEEP